MKKFDTFPISAPNTDNASFEQVPIIRFVREMAKMYILVLNMAIIINMGLKITLSRLSK